MLNVNLFSFLCTKYTKCTFYGTTKAARLVPFFVWLIVFFVQNYSKSRRNIVCRVDREDASAPHTHTKPNTNTDARARLSVQRVIKRGDKESGLLNLSHALRTLAPRPLQRQHQVLGFCLLCSVRLHYRPNRRAGCRFGVTRTMMELTPNKTAQL